MDEDFLESRIQDGLDTFEWFLDDQSSNVVVDCFRIEMFRFGDDSERVVCVTYQSVKSCEIWGD